MPEPVDPSPRASHLLTSVRRRDLRHVLTAALCCVLGTASFCEPTPEQLCDTVEGPFSVVLGTGLDAFTSFDDGDTLPYHRGPQGGTHIEAAARTKNLYFPTNPFEGSENLPLVGFQIVDALDGTTQLGGFEPYQHRITDAGEGVGEILGEAVFLFEDGSVLVGREALLRVQVTDMCGNEASAERRFVIGEER